MYTYSTSKFKIATFQNLRVTCGYWLPYQTTLTETFFKLLFLQMFYSNENLTHKYCDLYNKLVEARHLSSAMKQFLLGFSLLSDGNQDNLIVAKSLGSGIIMP